MLFEWNYFPKTAVILLLLCDKAKVFSFQAHNLGQWDSFVDINRS